MVPPVLSNGARKLAIGGFNAMDLPAAQVDRLKAEGF
jgi:hypothetical protein